MTKKFTFSRHVYLMGLLLMLFAGLPQKVLAQTYCTPTYTYGCSNGGTINSFFTTGATTNVSNLSTGCASGAAGYSNYTTQTITATQGFPFTVNVAISAYGSGVKIWGDWNQNGTFEATELCTASAATIAAGGTYTASVTVPATALTGNTRFRVRAVESSTTFDACANYSYGETEDYTINVVAPAACVNPPNPGTIAASVPDSICPNIAFALNTTGTTFGVTGMTYQWEQSPTGAAGTWVNLTGATTVNYTIAAGITANTYFRLKSICSGGTPVYSNAKMVAVKSFINCYCTPTYTYGCSNGGTINSFSTTGAMTNVTNLNTGCASGALGYSNYTSMTITAAQTFSFNFSVGISAYAAGVKIWADWNHDGVFDPVNELCAASTSTIAVGAFFTGSIIPPATALNGNTRFRVRAVEGSTSFDPCSNYTYGETEDYTINIIIPPACTAVTFPSNVHAIATPRTLCVSGNVALVIDSTMPQATGITYQWQSAPSGAGPWTNVGTASTTSSTNITGLTTTTYYRMQVLCNSNPIVTTSTDTVTVNNPGTVTAIPGSRCGPGQVALGATPSNPASIVRWYTAATGGAPIGTGQNFNTPYVPATTTFYASAGTAGVPTTASVGAGALTPSYDYVTIFAGGYGGYKHQFLITQAEMIAAGILPGNSINSISVTNLNGAFTYTGFEMKLGTTTATATTNTFQATGMTTVFPSANYTTTVGVNTFTFPTPYTYTGGSLVIQTCWSNGGYSTTYSNLAYDNTSYASTTVAPQDNSTPAQLCGLTASTYFSSPMNKRPKFTFNFDGSCQSPRVAVTATINAGPAVTKSAPPVVCNNAVATLSMTPPSPNPYTPYRWYPTTGLYTDAAATVPYTGTTANTVYMKSTVAGLHTYYAIGGDTLATSTTCSRADTFKVWVQPGNQFISGFPDTICASGSTVLTLNPSVSADYYTGSIQWQESLDGGITYANLAGATNVTYTTPTLTANRNYRVNVTANGATCAQPTKLVVVANPTFISKRDSFNCGPGQVTLRATTGGNSSPRWYENPTGGTAIGGGSVWQTPYLTQTDTFYVVGSGGLTPANITVGTGTSTSTGAETPYYGSWGGYKHQFLITAAELTALGASGGTIINSLAFDVVSGSTTYNGFAVSMGQTTATALATTTWLPVTQVKAPANWTTSTGFNTYNFDVPFTWDGTSNVVVQTCWSNATSSNPVSTVRYSTTSYVSTHYNYADYYTPADICSYTSGGSTISRRPNIRFGILKPCESAPRQAVIATIRPVPAPNLGPDVDTCIAQGSTMTLNPGTIPNTPTFVWDNGTTGATRDITQTGTYNVTVTNTYGCVGKDTVNVNMKWTPVVDLAAGGTGFCLGGTRVLDAGTGGLSGGNYYWNTGATSRTITINSPGTYIAYVTSNQGCLTIDTVNIVSTGYMPTIDGIISQPLAATSFKFSTVNPQNVTSFTWDFGDGTPLVTVPATASTVGLTNHTFPGGGNYHVKLKTYSVCGDIIDSTTISIIGLGTKDIDKDAKLVQVYPNPNNGNILYVEAIGDVKIKDVVVYNAIGQEVMTINKFDNNTKHKVTLPEHLASGIYSLRINTNKGLTTRKLEIVK